MNAAEKAAGFAITGDTGGEAGVAWSPSPPPASPATLAATSASDGTWSVQVPADAAYLTGTSVTVTVNATKTGFTDAAAVTRTLAVDLAAPALVSATVDGAVLTLTYGEDLDREAVPAGSAFTVKVGGTAADLAGTDPVAVSARAVTLTLAAPVAHGDTVTVSYTKPASRPVRDEAGNEAANLDDETVTNETADTEAPRVASIERQTPATSPTNVDTLVWRVTFSEDVQDVTRDDFALAGTNATLTVAAVQGSRSAYDVTAAGGDLAGLDGTVTLSFASAQDIKDLADNALANTAPTGTDERTWVVDNTAPTVSYTAPGSLTVGVAIADLRPATSDADIARYAASGLPARPCHRRERRHHLRHADDGEHRRHRRHGDGDRRGGQPRRGDRALPRRRQGHPGARASSQYDAGPR